MILQIDKITKHFGTKKVLDGINLEVDAGEAVAILGANGAGKTTLLRIVNRLIEPDSGEVLFCGHPMTYNDLSQVGYLPEERGLYRHMRAGKQLCYLAQLKGLTHIQAETEIRYWFDRLGIDSWWNRSVRQLSKGMQQKLQFIASVAHHPQLLILDEPFSGFDSENTEMLMHEVVQQKQQGTAILLSTHNLAAAKELCDRTFTIGRPNNTPAE